MRRLRKIALVLLLGFAAVTAGFWGWAQFYSLSVFEWPAAEPFHYTEAQTEKHGLLIFFGNSVPPFEWAVTEQHDPFMPMLWPHYSQEGGRPLIAVIPYWLPMLLALVSAALLWRYRPRVNPLVCSRCKYNLTGNTSGACPECGTSVIDPANGAGA